MLHTDPDIKGNVTVGFHGYRILGEQLLQLVDEYPSIMAVHVTDIIEFVQITNNMRGRQNFYGNLVSVLLLAVLTTLCS